MSTSLNQSAQPTVGRLIEILEEIKGLDLSLPDRNQPLEDQEKQYEIKKRIIKDKIKRLEIHVGILAQQKISTTQLFLFCFFTRRLFYGTQYRKSICRRDKYRDCKTFLCSYHIF